MDGVTPCCGRGSGAASRCVVTCLRPRAVSRRNPFHFHTGCVPQPLKCSDCVSGTGGGSSGVTHTPRGRRPRSQSVHLCRWPLALSCDECPGKVFSSSSASWCPAAGVTQRLGGARTRKIWERSLVNAQTTMGLSAPSPSLPRKSRCGSLSSPTGRDGACREVTQLRARLRRLGGTKQPPGLDVPTGAPV